MSVGRRPVIKDSGLENLVYGRTERGNICVNECMQASVPGIYVCGDLTGFSLLAHTAVREAEVAVHTILGQKDAMSYWAISRGGIYQSGDLPVWGQTEEALQLKVSTIGL